MRRVAAVAVVLVALAAAAAAFGATRITVFAAASLTNVFLEIDGHGRYGFAGSDLLAVQLREGAPADVYASAGPHYTQILYRDGVLLKPVVFATNKLIVLVPRANPAKIRSVYDLRREGVKVVIGDSTVPIGSYTRKLLDRLGITAAVAKNVVSQETDVKGIVSKVALGEADAGFVYRTDAKPVAADTRTIALPARAQPPILYEIAVVKASKHRAAARAFVAKVVSKRGRLLLARAGFGLP